MYGQINKQFRTGERSTEYADPPETVDKLVARIDSAIDKAELPVAMTLYRGIRSPKLAKGSAKKLVGSVISDGAFASTTAIKGLAGSNFAGRDPAHAVVMEIHAPKGTKAAYLDFGGEDRQEGEFLLPRDSSMKIVAVGKDDEGRRKLTMELVPKKAA